MPPEITAAAARKLAQLRPDFLGMDAEQQAQFITDLRVRRTQRRPVLKAPKLPKEPKPPKAPKVAKAPKAPKVARDPNEPKLVRKRALKDAAEAAPPEEASAEDSGGDSNQG